MFAFATSFNQPLTSTPDGWSTDPSPACTRCSRCFCRSTKTSARGHVQRQQHRLHLQWGDVVQPNLSSWDTSNVTDMGSMFASAAFVQPALNLDARRLGYVEGHFGGRHVLGAHRPSTKTSARGIRASSMTCPTCSRVLRVSTRTLGMECWVPDRRFGDVHQRHLSLENYNALLVGWVAQDVHGGVGFNGGNSQYSDRRTGNCEINLVDTKTWSVLMADSHRVPVRRRPWEWSRTTNQLLRFARGAAQFQPGGPVPSYAATALVRRCSPADPARRARHGGSTGHAPCRG